MDIEPPATATTADSDDTKSNDSTASQPKHIQEMAKSTVTMKENISEPVPPANDNATSSIDVPIPTTIAPQVQPQIPAASENGASSVSSQIIPNPMAAPQPQIESGKTEIAPIVSQTSGISNQPPTNPQNVPPQSVPPVQHQVIPPTHGPENSGPPPNVTVSQQGPIGHHMPTHMGHQAVPSHMPSHQQYGYPPRPYYGMPPYGQYPYSYHQQPYHSGPPPPANYNMHPSGHHYQQPQMQGPVQPQQNPAQPITSPSHVPAVQQIPVSVAPLSSAPSTPGSGSEESAPEKNGSN